MSPRTAQQSRRTTIQVVLRLFAVVAGIYALTLVWLFTQQRTLVFNAEHSRRAAMIADEAHVPLPVGVTALHLTTPTGDHVTAYYGHAQLADGRPDPKSASRPTLLFFYGKGSSLAYERPLLASLQRLDINVLMPDYIGFGLSSGIPSEAHCYETADVCYRYLCSRPEVTPITLAGYSLGSGVAVDLAARELSVHQPVAGLALFAAYTSLADEAHEEYPFYPTALLRVLLRYPFDSIRKMPRVTCPVLLVHSRADRLIPFRMADTLASACPGPVTRVTVFRADHGSYFTADGTLIFPALAHFIESSKS